MALPSRLLKRFVIPILIRRTMATVERRVQLTEGAETYNINFISSGSGRNGVILLPGALGSAETDFSPQLKDLPHLLPNHTIVAWDPPGYGKSRPPERTFPVNYFNRDAAVANSLMRTLGFDQYSVLGWSGGGVTGSIMAANHPDAVENLVIWGTCAFILSKDIKIYENLRDVSKWSSKMCEPMEKMYGVEYFPKLWSAWVDGMQKIFTERNGDFCKEELKKVQANTLIVHGGKDTVVSPCHVPYLRNAIKSASYYEFPEGKHNLHLRYPDEFNELVSTFLLSSEDKEQLING